MSDVTDRANCVNVGITKTTNNFAYTHALKCDYIFKSKDGSTRRQFFVGHHETVRRILHTSTCSLPSWPTYPLLGLPTKKMKVHQFQICCARTKHLSERHKGWTVIAHATAIFSHINMSWSSRLSVKNWVKFGSCDS